MARYRIADLFCGAGGTSTGAMEAVSEMGAAAELTAINHWPRAIETHSLNHPEARHLCTNIDSVDPRGLFKLGELDLLWASPECMHHSVARGGRPVNDQSRATAWCVTRWAEALQPKVILVENVPEFRDWGPIGTNGKPLKSRKGEIFRSWCAALASIGYRVDYRVLCAADYGDPTMRRRLFVQAVRGRRQIRWPEATHFPSEENLLKQKPYRSAKEIINWEHESQSIFERQRPLADNTLKRIEIGLRKFGLRPFLVPQQQRHVVRDLEKPMQTVVGSARGEGFCEPFLVKMNGRSDVSSVEVPAPAVTTKNGLGVCEPFLVSVNHGGSTNGRVRPVSEPLPAVTTRNGVGVCKPFLVRVGHYGKNGNGAVQVNDVEDPLSTVTTKQEHGFVEPFLVHLRGTGVPRSVDVPLPTVTSGGRHIALCEPFLTKFYGAGSGAHSINEPLDTVTVKDRFGLVQPRVEIDGEEYLLDIHFRMLQPDELALAQGFPKGYEFAGTKTEVTKQIGNAVPCGLAKALVKGVLG